MHNHDTPASGALPFPDEIAHLNDITRMLDDALARAQDDVAQLGKEYMDMKRYMADYRGEIDPHEMFQNQLGLRQIDNTGAFAVAVRDKLAKLKASPYFARIDFRPDSSGEADVCYIGRFAFARDNTLHISDWRSPLAGMFYDYDVGPAGYVAPMGPVSGELTRKRQFKIEHGVMEYALESAVNIQDDVLQRTLAETSDDRMKSIIATIQKEQNPIIRDEKTGTLVIQGVAGSGKTSVALHRIAFLLYRFQDRLSARHVAILSPNKVFGDYISNVLPELGEEPIAQIRLEDIARVHLGTAIHFAPDRDPFAAADAAWVERTRFKSTLDFVRLMEEFVARMPEIVFDPVDYVHGRFVVTTDHLRARFLALRAYPVKRRLQMMADDVLGQWAANNCMEDDIPRRSALIKALKSMLRVKSTLALYRAFYRAIGRPKHFVMAGKGRLEWADVFPFLYLHAAYEGLRESPSIRHLVVDEMQDYSPIQYAVLNRLFPCPKTLLGDFGQAIHPCTNHTLDDLMQLYGDGRLVKLTTSYRSSYEIIAFARQIQENGELKAIKRHGPVPEVVGCRFAQAQMQQLRKRIERHRQSRYHTLGVIVKTNEAARTLFDSLRDIEGIHLIRPESSTFEGGISVTSIQMAKGLEFDEVIVLDADADTYRSAHDRSLLYVACTRAMHTLSLLHAGSRSPLLPAEA